MSKANKQRHKKTEIMVTKHTNSTLAKMQIKLNTGKIIEVNSNSTYVCENNETIVATKFDFEKKFKSVKIYRLY